jgi:uncharacterized protein with PIN domain
MGTLIRFRERSEGKDEFDVCVLCGRRTHFRKNDSIQARVHYIEGAGQLCPDCYTDLWRSVAGRDE